MQGVISLLQPLPPPDNRDGIPSPSRPAVDRVAQWQALGFSHGGLSAAAAGGSLGLAGVAMDLGDSGFLEAFDQSAGYRGEGSQGVKYMLTLFDPLRGLVEISCHTAVTHL